MTGSRHGLLPGLADVEIDCVEIDLPGGRARVQRHLVTNALLCRVVNEADLESWQWGGYRCLNDFNDDQPVKRDWLTRRLEVDGRSADHPAVGVSWLGAAAFATAVGGRLLLPAEWAWLASNGGRSTYPWGDEAPAPWRANYAEYVGSTTPVGQYPPSPLGLFDLAGNVSEWCSPAPGAELAAEAMRLSEQPVAGGSWNKPADALAATTLRTKWARIGTVSIGFRVAFDLDRP
ncbi:formylglycine-generating enzyme family protein [Jatrophihabitans sp.]|uniref:formylglycine-generating enzyme family protein n=1 Tax=Jatrophihabitans sp. TaxID=1932789 RepID=UPI002BA9076B|nr:SUMF1/EgtB/PvdO family nonheme iron enzyme [Jatrophihabitans sp.]